MFCCYANISNSPSVPMQSTDLNEANSSNSPAFLFWESSRSSQGWRKAYLLLSWPEGSCTGMNVSWSLFPCGMLSFILKILKRYFARPGFGYHWTAFRLQVYDLYASNRNKYKVSKILHSLLNPLKSGLFLKLFPMSPNHSQVASTPTVSGYSRNTIENVRQTRHYR